MTAIFGYGSFQIRGEAYGDEILRVSDAMVPRGPDAEGAWFSTSSPVAFAHRRLKIIDLDSRADQPMHSSNGALAIVFNGEIYNYRELRSELQGLGHEFQTKSDTEVTLAAYGQWQEQMFSRLRGMYAFALWDHDKSRLLLGRDPYGIKPLFYSDDGSTIRVASQVKALLAGGQVSRAVDPAGMVGFLLMGSVPEPFTVHENIRALPAGHAMWIGKDGPVRSWAHSSVANTWLHASDAGDLFNEDEQLQYVAEALRDSVASHLVADVPVGAFLSAGIDSGALVGLMRECISDLRTVTLGFEKFRGTHDDETALAGEVARQYGTRNQEYWIDTADVLGNMSAILEAMDQPSIDGINTWLVSKAAHDLGLKVVVSGVGGDELFGGYSTFRELPSWQAKLRMMNKVPGAIKLASTAAAGLAKAGVISPKAAALLNGRTDLRDLYRVRRGVFAARELEQLFDGEWVREGLRRLANSSCFYSNMERLPHSGNAAVGALESCGYLRNQLLRDSDWASMAHSLELRTPLVDYELLQRIAPLTARYDGHEHPKASLAAAPKIPLPGSVVHRKKTGFSVPMAEWVKKSPELDSWKAAPRLSKSGVHWSKRMAYSLAARVLEADGC